MFDSGYTFNLIDSRHFSSDGSLLRTWKYNFKSYRRRYIVDVELYNGSIYVIKYYAACHAASQHKYNLILNDERPAPIIRTCVDIMLRLYDVDPNASFGFIGSNSVNKKRKGRVVEEDKMNTQRFRIYQMVIFNFFGPKTFEHARSVKHSAYLLINRHQQPIEQFKQQVEKMFATIYIAFEM